jgi:plastocyanin
MTPRIFALSLAIAIAAALLVAACSAGTKAAPSSGSAAGPTISIVNSRFSAPATVSPGATVTVANGDGAEHTVTADSGKAFDVEVEGNGTATFTAPSRPGTYAYHCNYHPMMHGELIVQ